MTSGSSWCTVYKSFLRIIPIRILSFTFIKLFQCWLGAYLPSAILRDSEVESNRNINKDAKFFSISFFVLRCLLCVDFERDECISTAINCTYERDTSLHSSPVTLVSCCQLSPAFQNSTYQKPIIALKLTLNALKLTHPQPTGGTRSMHRVSTCNQTSVQHDVCLIRDNAKLPVQCYLTLLLRQARYLIAITGIATTSSSITLLSIGKLQQSTLQHTQLTRNLFLKRSQFIHFIC